MLALATAASPAQAKTLKPISVNALAQAALCRAPLAMGYLSNTLLADLGSPDRQEQGAFWWKTSFTVFGQAVSEVFIADASTTWRFIGFVFKGQKPDALAKGPSLGGAKFWQVPPAGPYSEFVSHSGAVLRWHQGTDAKLLCAVESAPWHYQQHYDWQSPWHHLRGHVVE